jgi:hypothetical protein
MFPGHQQLGPNRAEFLLNYYQELPSTKCPFLNLCYNMPFSAMACNFPNKLLLQFCQLAFGELAMLSRRQIPKRISPMPLASLSDVCQVWHHLDQKRMPLEREKGKYAKM